MSAKDRWCKLQTKNITSVTASGPEASDSTPNASPAPGANRADKAREVDALHGSDRSKKNTKEYKTVFHLTKSGLQAHNSDTCKETCLDSEW